MIFIIMMFHISLLIRINYISTGGQGSLKETWSMVHQTDTFSCFFFFLKAYDQEHKVDSDFEDILISKSPHNRSNESQWSMQL